MLSVIGTNHQPEYLDKDGRLWRFKSTWELRFAKWLDVGTEEITFTWVYEPCALLLSDGRRYFPDFWVKEWDAFVEIKAGHRSVEKCELAMADGHRVVVLRGNAVKKFLGSSK